METNKKELTSNQVCMKYGISRVTLDRYKKERNLPYYKRGRNVFFVAEEIEEWMNNYNKIQKFNCEDKENSVN